MNKLSQTLATAAGAGLIALGVYQFNDCTSLRYNPHRTHEISHILNLQEDMEHLQQQFMEIYHSESKTRHIWFFNEKSRELLDKLNEPTNAKLNTLKELCETYDTEIDRLTMTNKNWENYCQWNKDTKAKNKSNLIYGLIASLSGLGLLGLSRKN